MHPGISAKNFFAAGSVHASRTGAIFRLRPCLFAMAEGGSTCGVTECYKQKIMLKTLN